VRPYSEHLNAAGLSISLSLGVAILMFSTLVAQTCRTPDHTGYILFEPCGYLPMGHHSQYCDTALTHQGYLRDRFYLQQNPPGLLPDVTLDDFAEVLEYFIYLPMPIRVAGLEWSSMIQVWRGWLQLGPHARDTLA